MTYGPDLLHFLTGIQWIQTGTQWIQTTTTLILRASDFEEPPNLEHQGKRHIIFARGQGDYLRGPYMLF